MIAGVVRGSTRPFGSLRRLAVILASAVALAGCKASGPEVFASPDAAVDALVQAVRSEDAMTQLKKVFGSDADQYLSSGDEVADRKERAQFLDRFERGHRLVEGPDGSKILEIDTDHWPFAFPLVQADGGWKFDVERGADELLNRRIGANELDAIQTLLAIVDAQREYARMDVDGDGVREYATKFVSDPGRRNGLSWPTAPGEPHSPLGDLIGQAAAEGRERGDPYHGYWFRMLFGAGPGARGGAFDYRIKGNLVGGFGVIAWPATYGVSGIKTFIVNQEGVVHQRDLGEDTDRIARTIDLFDPAGWERVPESDTVPR